MYLTYFKREFAKKHGNSGVLTRFVLLLSGIGTCGINYAHIAIATVATSESVFLIPHFASTEAIPAKNADKTAITSHI